MEMDQFINIALSLLGWSAVGVFALFAARKVYDVMTPFEVEHELVTDRNVAVGISKGMFLVAIGILVHGLLASEKVSKDIYVELLMTLVLLVISFIIMALGRWLLVKTTPVDFDKEIHEKNNTALSLIEGAWYIALATIISAAL
ncbi:MAG: DUF350 domain-containing protein [Myxococcota bacterium]|nr:DUF350 domain-containing protein [Myxococcota bacterium]